MFFSRRVATVATLPSALLIERFLFARCKLGFSFQPVLPPDYRSRFLPRWLGYWLLLDGICWVVFAVTGFLAPAYNGVLFRAFQPAFLA